MSKRFTFPAWGRAFRGREVNAYDVALALLGLLLAIQAVRFVWLLVTPVGPVGDYRANELQVLSPASRLALFASFDPFAGTAGGEGATVVTSLPLTLYGIRQNLGSGGGSAILAGPDGVQDSYPVGGEIQPGVTLYAVAFDHVVIDRGGARESLYLDQSVPAETVGGTAPAIASPTGVAAPTTTPDAASVAQAVGFAPRNENGRVTGIVLSPQGDGALFRAAGFRDGDIIVSVSGAPVTSAADIDRLRRQIAPGARLSVEVERGANRVPIAVNLPSAP